MRSEDYIVSSFNWSYTRQNFYFFVCQFNVALDIFLIVCFIIELIMFNAYYTNNETYVGALNVNNELTLSVDNFLQYARHVKSTNNNGSKRTKRTVTNSATTTTNNSSTTSTAVNNRDKYLLNEFIVNNTRMQYYDNEHRLGFATGQYASSSVIQNVERLVIYPDIGYYTTNTNNRQTGNGTKKSNHVNKNDKRQQPTSSSLLQRSLGLLDHRRNDDSYVHSDYTRKNSPQEAWARVLSMPLFNGNNTKTILQSSKSERYYQLTFPLENCGRMYVLAGPVLPCYSIAVPWAYVCRLLQINPLVPPTDHVIPIDQAPVSWHYLKQTNNVKYVILFPENLSLMNRRDPVIQEGSIETITMFFAYDDADADIQYNNPYGCYNKHEDYDGDTNTQSIGKGVESYTEIYFNMKRQCLPCLRIKSVVPQNMLSRIMMYFLHELPSDFNMQHDNLHVLFGDHNINSEILSREIVQTLENNNTLYSTLTLNQYKAMTTEETPLNKVRRIFIIELFRRACLCVMRLVSFLDGNLNSLRVTTRIFRRQAYGLMYLTFLGERWKKIRPKIVTFARQHLTTSNYANFDDKIMYNDTRNILHEIHRLWTSVSKPVVTNCQTLIDDVTRAVYCVAGEQECTRMLDHCSLIVHSDWPNFFLGQDPYELKHIVTVLSRAKGDFDSLLLMHVTLYDRFRTEAREREWERSRSEPLTLAHRDILKRVSYEQINKYIDYTDKYVLGSKKIPKSCKHANSMKCAMQNVQYFDGHLWMDDELILPDVIRHFSLMFFSNKNIIDFLLKDSLLPRHKKRSKTIIRTVDRSPCQSTLNDDIVQNRD